MALGACDTNGAQEPDYNLLGDISGRAPDGARQPVSEPAPPHSALNKPFRRWLVVEKELSGREQGMCAIAIR